MVTAVSNFPQSVKIVEVGPRDGLQNYSTPLTVQQRIQFTDMLSQSGFQEIEAAAFVSPVWVPQMVSGRSLMLSIQRQPNTIYTALVPNERGMHAALQARASKVAVFTAASETFNKKNINATIAESIERFRSVLPMAEQHFIPVRGYVSTAFYCPFEGKIDPKQVLPVVQRLIDLGITDISIGDTIGKAEPEDVKRLLDVLLSVIPLQYLGMHFHDTYHHALDNVRASLQYGISIYDSSAGGIGGCPYAPGAKGNVATYDLVQLLDSLGIYTGINLSKLRLAELYLKQATSEASLKKDPSKLSDSTDKHFLRQLEALVYLARAHQDVSRLLKSKFNPDIISDDIDMMAADQGELKSQFESLFKKLNEDYPAEFQKWLDVLKTQCKKFAKSKLSRTPIELTLSQIIQLS